MKKRKVEDKITYTNWDEDSDKRYLLEVVVKYPKELHKPNSDLSFLTERIKMKNVRISFVLCMVRKIMSYISKP